MNKGQKEVELQKIIVTIMKKTMITKMIIVMNMIIFLKKEKDSTKDLKM